MSYQDTQHNLWSSLERPSMPFRLQSSQRQMPFSAPKFKKTGLCTIGAAGLVIIGASLLVLHGSSSIRQGSYLEFPYFSATTRSKPSTVDYHDVYNETLGVCTVASEPSVTSILTPQSFRKFSWFRCPNALTGEIPLLYKQGYLTSALL